MVATSISPAPTRVRERGAGPGLAYVPEGKVPAPGSRRHVSMVAICYIGLVAIVVATILLRAVLPSAVGAVLFAVAATVLVLVLHPRITLRR